MRQALLQHGQVHCAGNMSTSQTLQWRQGPKWTVVANSFRHICPCALQSSKRMYTGVPEIYTFADVSMATCIQAYTTLVHKVVHTAHLSMCTYGPVCCCKSCQQQSLFGESLTHLTEVHLLNVLLLTNLPWLMPSALPCCFSFFLSYQLPQFSKQRSIIIGTGNPTVNGCQQSAG